MKESFDELYKMAIADRKKSPWSRKKTLNDCHSHLAGEVEEIRQALEQEDFENLREELGDSLFDVLAFIVVAEEKGLLKGKDVIDAVMVKFKRRKPWIFNDEVMTEDDEIRRWNEAKRLEKSAKQSKQSQ
jgi:NTP pyrophosphatase (non-canonical NTP hydrolase)